MVLKLSNRVKYLLDKSRFTHRIRAIVIPIINGCIGGFKWGCISPWNAIPYEQIKIYAEICFSKIDKQIRNKFRI